jgi:glutathione S-transferase
MEGGEAVFDSRVIVEYLDARSPLARLIPEPNRERTEVRTWEALADGLIDAAILARLEATWAGRSAEQRSQAWIDRQMKKIDAALEAMSTGLADKPWYSGIHMTLADIAVGCALGYLAFRFPQIAWRERANLARLADKMNARQSFIDTAPRNRALGLASFAAPGRSRCGDGRCAPDRIGAEAAGAGHRPVGAEHLQVQVAVEQLAGLHERQQVGEQLDAVLRVAPDDVIGGDAGRVVEARRLHQLLQGHHRVLVEVVDALGLGRHVERLHPLRSWVVTPVGQAPVWQVCA